MALCPPLSAASASQNPIFVRIVFDCRTADDPAMMPSTMFAMRSQLGRKILATLMCMASLISSRPLLSEEPSKGFASAVDAQGVRHSWSNHKKNPPWIDDAIKTVRPQYPYLGKVAIHYRIWIVSAHSRPKHWFCRESCSDQINRKPHVG